MDVRECITPQNDHVTPETNNFELNESLSIVELEERLEMSGSARCRCIILPE